MALSRSTARMHLETWHVARSSIPQVSYLATSKVSMDNTWLCSWGVYGSLAALWQCMLKHAMKQSQQSVAINKVYSQLQGGIDTCHIKLDTKLGVLRDCVPETLVHAFWAINHQDRIQRVSQLEYLNLTHRVLTRSRLLNDATQVILTFPITV